MERVRMIWHVIGVPYLELAPLIPICPLDAIPGPRSLDIPRTAFAREVHGNFVTGYLTDHFILLGLFAFIATRRAVSEGNGGRSAACRNEAFAARMFGVVVEAGVFVGKAHGVSDQRSCRDGTGDRRGGCRVAQLLGDDPGTCGACQQGDGANEQSSCE
jgi:hypothetical protein